MDAGVGPPPRRKAMLFEISMILYGAALFVWVQHLMIKQARDDRKAQEAYQLLKGKVDGLQRVCEMHQKMLKMMSNTKQ
jgi:hypothetical protein